MLNFLTMGTILGLSAGFAPGPLLTLVISETLQYGIKSGIKVALAPFITDLPIIIVTLFILSKLSGFNNILGGISIIGGIFIIFLGYGNIRTKGINLSLKAVKPQSLTRGIIVNALSPHPYLFWFSVGGPMVTRAMNINILFPLVFVCSFYGFLVGSKMMLAIVVGKSRSFLTGNRYLYAIRFLGLLLWGLAIVLIGDGLKLLEII